MRFTLFFAALFGALTLQAQTPSGSQTFTCLTIYPHNQPNVYLLDFCGEVVHTWANADTCDQATWPICKKMATSK